MSIINAESSYTNVLFCCLYGLREYSYCYTNKKDGKILLDNRTKLYLLGQHASASVFYAKYCTQKCHLGNFLHVNETEIYNIV